MKLSCELIFRPSYLMQINSAREYAKRSSDSPLIRITLRGKRKSLSRSHRKSRFPMKLPGKPDLWRPAILTGSLIFGTSSCPPWPVSEIPSHSIRPAGAIRSFHLFGQRLGSSKRRHSGSWPNTAAWAPPFGWARPPAVSRSPERYHERTFPLRKNSLKSRPCALFCLHQMKLAFASGKPNPDGELRRSSTRGD